MQKKTETLITGIRSARNRLKKLLAITKDTQMMKVEKPLGKHTASFNRGLTF